MKLLSSCLVRIVLAASLLLTATGAHAQIPLQMNYQVMLTDDLDEPLADQSVQLVFHIYNVDAGGGSLWTETHNVTTNSIGVASVVLGSTNPIHLLFNVPLWLQVEVDGEVMEPRRPLVSAPYARRADEANHAIEADQAVNSDHALSSDQLDGIPASAWALDDDLWQVGTLNDPANPMEWTKLKNVPAGFADGTDDVGTGVGGSGTANYVPKFTGSATIGNSVIYETGERVGIGTTTPAGRLAVENADNEPALRLTSTAPVEHFGVLHVERTDDMVSGESLVHLGATQSSTGGLFLSCGRQGSTGGYAAFWVDLDGGIYSVDEMDITSDEDKVIDAYSYHESSDTRVISGVYGPGGSLPYDATGVYGESKPQDWWGIGGSFEGGYIGAEGRVNPTGGNFYFGLIGSTSGGSGTNYGVHGSASSGDINYGVYGTAWGGSESWAGYFEGAARVTGTFYNPGPVLELDHPSDPENSYLRHALVASSEMKTVYDGTVVLDSAGEAMVALPDWFEDLNSDFRYQLTPIGAPAPRLHVADTVNGGRFRIAGGEPGMTVSWQVTGVRHDAYAAHRPLIVEEEKSPKDRGRYLSPEAHGAPKDAGIGHLEDKKAGK